MAIGKAIPFNVPLVGREEAEAARDAVRARCLSGNGPIGRRLEREIAAIVGVRYAFFTNSCTSAVEMALLALEIGPGDEVICPSFSFVSVANSIVRTGARLVFIDIDERTLNVDAPTIERALTKRTKAVVVVHYGGASAPMGEIMRLARRRGLAVIEDAAQAIGSYYGTKHLGAIGDAGAISFHGTKSITCGEGGVFLTNRRDLAEKADIIREKGTNRSDFIRGAVDKYHWISIGSSYVQSDVLAAIARVQLRRVRAVTQACARIASIYNECLEPYRGIITLPRVVERARPNWHLYALRLRSGPERDRFIALMRRRGVECASHFVALHASEFARRHLGYGLGDFPVTERACERLARLPIYPQLGLAGARRVARCAGEVLAEIHA